MSSHKLSISKAYSHAGRAFWRQPLFVIISFLAITAVGAIGSFLLNLSPGNASALLPFIVTLGGIATVIIGELLKFGFKQAALRLVDQENTDYTHLATTSRKGVHYLVGMVVFNLMVIGVPGLLLLLTTAVSGTGLMLATKSVTGVLVISLLILIGGFLALVFHLFPFVLLDSEADVWSALETSRRITRGARFELVVFYAVAVLLNIVGLLLAGVGLIVTIPLTWLAQAHAYRQLAEHSKSWLKQFLPFT